MIYTDASYSDIDAGLGAWAMVALADGKPPLRHAAVFRDRIEWGSSTVAEMQAAANAIAYARKHGLVPDGARIVIISDSQAVVETIKGTGGHVTFRQPKPGETIGKTRAGRIALAAAYSHVLRWVKRCGATITSIKVKAHSKRSETCPHWEHNDWCDRACTKIMRETPILAERKAASRMRRAERKAETRRQRALQRQSGPEGQAGL